VPKAAPSQSALGDAVVIPYSSIIKLIPQELWGKLAPAGVAGYNYAIARKTVLEQLPHGAVKVTFGELRRNAPAGIFITGSAEDSRQIDLPLAEVLTQLHPDALSRRPDQARVLISSDVPDLFGAKGERLAPLRVMERKEVSTSTITRQKGAAGPALPAPKLPAPVAPVAPTPPSVPVAPFAAPPAAAPAPVVRPQFIAPVSPAPVPAAARPAPVPPFALPKAPAATTTPTLPRPVVPLPAAVPPVPQPAPPVQPLPLVQPAAPAAANGPFGTASFFLPLPVVAESWPDGVRQELAQIKIPDAKIALPPVEICEGLKRGRIQYPWRTLRSWIQPTPIYATPSPHDDEMLELPLRTLTPLFLDFIRANPVNRQAADAENITEFFRKAEQASGTTPELLQPLFAAPAGTPVVVPAPLVAPASLPAPQIIPPAAPMAVPAAPAAAVPTTSAEPTIENGYLCLPLTLIANGWPEPVMHDMASFGLGASRVEIPLPFVEAGLKAGRLDFAWRELCGWLNPPSKPAQISINGENRISLPLGLIAPLFLKSRGGAQARKRTNVAEDIPDLFNAAGKPLAPPPASAAPAPVTPVAAPAPAAPVPEVPAAAAPKKTPTNLSELFNEPAKKSWTPNEIVQRCTLLPNVSGALIALQDGLLVANNLPAELKSDTIAAFVPQIFGRLNQYSKELQMGDTKAVSFTVECGTFQVFNAGLIYFAAYGKLGALLPLAELQLIAAELGRHTK
jgi:predicted regulator of Ras-like GTPase activity (Roadblock/LC7/MglB family)